jgi:hypothetical protein
MLQNYKHILHNFSTSFGEYTTATGQTNNGIIRAVQKCHWLDKITENICCNMIKKESQNCSTLPTPCNSNNTITFQLYDVSKYTSNKLMSFLTNKQTKKIKFFLRSCLFLSQPRNSPNFIEPKIFSLCSPHPTICLCLNPDKSSPYLPVPLLQDLF